MYCALYLPLFYPHCSDFVALLSVKNYYLFIIHELHRAYASQRISNWSSNCLFLLLLRSIDVCFVCSSSSFVASSIRLVSLGYQFTFVHWNDSRYFAIFSTFQMRKSESGFNLQYLQATKGWSWIRKHNF